jgi:AraC-like DNA-binding protein
MDALSELLRAVRLKASLYAAWELKAPWGIDFPAAEFATFHSIESGSCWLIERGGSALRLDAGDLAVVFCGGHRLVDRRGRATIPLSRLLRQAGAAHRHGGAGAATQLVCGKFVADEAGTNSRAFQGFPSVWHMTAAECERSALDQTLKLLAEESRAARPGWELVVTRFTEALFVYVLRDLVGRSEHQHLGWLDAFADPQISAALGLIHRDPGKRWTVGSLATRVALSRTVFAARFVGRVGVTPIEYLTSWRLRLAARALRESDRAIAEIANSLGYSTVAAFHRAFQRAFGVSPGAFRRSARTRRQELGTEGEDAGGGVG